MTFDIETIIRFALALLWGGLVGAEREYRGKAAGFRTTIMISFGACFFTLMSTGIGGPGNPDRIAANIVTGIGFLGAGVIFRGDDRVNGITTAATIWAVAAVGMGLGAGYYFAAACASVLIFFILAVLPFLQQKIDRLNQMKILEVRCSRDSNAKTLCETEISRHQLKGRLLKQVRESDTLNLTWQVRGRSERLEAFVAVILEHDHLERVAVN